MSESVKILLVEDSEEDAMILSQVLRSGGIKPDIHRIDTLEELDQALHQERWDIVIADYFLPRFDGLEALRFVKKHSPELPFIMVSGKTGEDFAVEAMRAGAQDFVVKGRLSRLSAAILREVEQRNNQSEEIRSISTKLETLIEMLPDWFFYKDLQGCYQLVNKAFADFNGLTRQAVIGKTVSEFMQPDLAAGSMESDRITLIQRKMTRHELTTTVNGKKFYLDTIKVPLMDGDGNIIGILGVSRDITEKKEIEIALIAEQKALAARNILLQRAWEQTILVLSHTTEVKDPYTSGHQKRAAELAVAIAKVMKLDQEQTVGLKMAAMIHDIGKINVPAEILSKPGALSEIEMELIKTHAQAGWEILKDIDLPWNVAEIVQQHHERLNGSGYPRGLCGNEILLEAKIIAVADSVEAMSSHRPYRPALGIKKALAEIRKGRDSLYEPAVVNACITAFTHDHFQFPS